MSWATRNIGAGRIGIAVFILFMYGMAMAVLVVTPIPDTNRDTFALLVGGLTTALGGVVGFFFNVAARRSNGGTG